MAHPTNARDSRRVFVFACAFVLTGEASRGIVFGTLSTYLSRLHGGSLLGTTVALFGVGRLLSSICGGWLAKRTSNLLVFEASLVVNVIGSLLYLFAIEAGLWALILGRICLGFGTGSLSTARAAVAETTTVQERTRYMAILDASKFIGYALTPFIGVVLGYVKVTWRGIVLDEVSSPGLVLAVANAALLIYSRCALRGGGSATASLCCRRGAVKREGSYQAVADGMKVGDSEEEDVAPPPDETTPLVPRIHNGCTADVASPAASETASDASGDTPTEQQPSTSAPSTPPSAPLDSRSTQAGVVLLIVLNLVVMGTLALLETIGTPMLIRIAYTRPNGTEEASATQDANMFFLYLGLVGLVAYMALAFKWLRMPELYLLALSFAVAAAGAFVMDSIGPLSYARMLVGCGLVWSFSTPVSCTVVISTLSKFVNPSQQSVYMGYITAAGSTGRVVFPLLSDALSNHVVVLLAGFISFACAAVTTAFKFIMDRRAREIASGVYVKLPPDVPTVIELK